MELAKRCKRFPRNDCKQSFPLLACPGWQQQRGFAMWTLDEFAIWVCFRTWDCHKTTRAEFPGADRALEVEEAAFDRRFLAMGAFPLRCDHQNFW